MFRDVPECSGMFHVPDFIDALLKLHFRLWREAQKVTQLFESFFEITLLWYKIII